jgi:hypothetical protein
MDMLVAETALTVKVARPEPHGRSAVILRRSANP